MRLVCFICGKSVSTDVEPDTIVRAVLICPECVPAALRDDVRTIVSDLPVHHVETPDHRSGV